MTKQPSSITEYISWLLQHYHEIRKQGSPQTLYRLVEIKETDDNQHELFFQIIGKAVVFKATPEDVLRNDSIIEHFSSNDIRIVTKLACKKLNLPKNKIVSKSFSEKLNKLLFKIKGVTHNSAKEGTAAELSTNKDFIQSLGPEDAHMIGYVAAQEQQIEDKEAIKALRDF